MKKTIAIYRSWNPNHPNISHVAINISDPQRPYVFKAYGPNESRIGPKSDFRVLPIQEAREIYTFKKSKRIY